METLQPFEPDEYIGVLLNGTREKVRGLVVGRLAVRRASPLGETHAGPNGGRLVASGQWVVDVLESSVCIGTFLHVEVALQVADEISRFATGSLETVSSLDDATRALGKDLYAWVNALDPGAMRVMGFREWKADRVGREDRCEWLEDEW